MDVREKLIELQMQAKIGWTKEEFADHLIAHGVTVQVLDGCEYCEEYEDLPEHFVSGKPVGRVFDTCIQTDENGRWHLEVPSGADIGIKFCPVCGRKLPQPMTNADSIRSMNDEELAEFLIDLADDGNLRIREWLQQPAEGVDND